MNTGLHPVRIVHVIDGLNKGGTQTALLHLVHGLSRKGYEQKIYCLGPRIHPENKDVLLGSGVETIHMMNRLFWLGIDFFRILVQWKRWRPDIVCTMLFYSDNIGRTCAKLTSVPVIISSLRARNTYKKPWHFFIDRMTAPWAHKIVINSRDIAPFAMRHEGISEQQIEYIPNGVNVNERPQNNTARRKELGIPLGVRVIGSVGRLHEQKGFDFLIPAFAIVRAQIKNSVLVIVGRGKLETELKELARKSGVENAVLFLGEQTNVPEILMWMEVYVQASLYEGMSNATMEAMAAGLPVVATRVEGSRELIFDGKTGWLTDPKDVQGLAEKIMYTLNNRQIAQEVGKAAYEHVKAKYSIESMVSAYDSLFRRLVEQYSPPKAKRELTLCLPERGT
jgi:glycosyltransferase involved in cell wall biosynthesis